MTPQEFVDELDMIVREIREDSHRVLINNHDRHALARRLYNQAIRLAHLSDEYQHQIGMDA